MEFSPLLALAVVALLSPPCPAVVDARGPAATALQQALARRAVDAPTDGCPGIIVQIQPRAEGFDVRRGDARPQIVPTLETAALLVETWVRADLIDPLLAARAGPPLPTPPVPASTPPPPAPPRRDLHVDFGLHVGAAGDKSVWAGGYAQGCLELGPLCVGVRGQAIVDPGIRGASETARVWRLGLGVLATGDIDLGPVRTGIGLGVVSAFIERKNSRTDDIQGAPLLQARVGVPIQFTDAWALTLGVNAGLALWPRKRDQGQAEEDFPDLPHGTVMASIGMRWSTL